MAARRVAKSAVDWAAFAERVPPNQKDAFRAFKARSDYFLSRVYRYPETPAAIDFAYYRSRLSSPALVDKMEKEYTSLQVPYPTDSGNVKGHVDQLEKQAEESYKTDLVEAQKMMADAKALLKKIDNLPKPEEMTHEMYADYFPQYARNPVKKPSFWPHTKDYQPENDKDTVH